MEDPHFNGVAKATTRPQGIWCSVKTAVPTVETVANGGSIRIQKPQMLLQMYLSTPSACCLILKGLESAFTEELFLLSQMNYVSFHRGTMHPFTEELCLLSQRNYASFHRGIMPPFTEELCFLSQRNYASFHRGTVPPFTEELCLLSQRNYASFHRGTMPPFT